MSFPRSGNSAPSTSQADTILQFKSCDSCGTSHDIEPTAPTYRGEERKEMVPIIPYPNHSKIIVLPFLDEDKLVKKENPEELESKL